MAAIQWLTAAELASLGLPSWPSSEFRSRAKLLKLGTPSRLREGSRGGGGREYDTSTLPTDVRRALLQHQVRTAPEVLPLAAPAPEALPLVAAPEAAVPALPSSRKPPSRAEATCADARVLLVNRLLELAQVDGMTRATETLSHLLSSGDAPADLLQVAATANQRPRSAEGGVAISARTLFRWVGEHRKGGWFALCPKPAQQMPLSAVGDDVALVLKRYASTSGAARNLTEVTQAVLRDTTGSIEGWKALYDRARRALPKVDQVKLIKARHTGNERASKLPYMRRKTGDLMPLDVCLVDGHTFKAKVRHPEHGQPFAPEVTVLIDAATRKICGWSVAYSENVIAVGDCIRHAATTHGVWAIYYTDNGPGEKNKQFDCPAAGLFARLGAEHKLGRPGHAQGHGLVERSWRTHMIRAARQFGSFQGGDADSGKVRDLRLEIARERTALKKAEATGEVVRLTAKVPSWDRFIDVLKAEIDRYNGEHEHRSLPKHEGGARDGKHMTPDEAWSAWLNPADQMLLDGPAGRMLHMPAKVATAQRGWVVLNKAHYFNADLMQVDGQKVRVHFDIHDPRAVWVWSVDGQFICEAGLDANSMDYMPKSVVQMAREKRRDRRVALRQDQIALAEAEVGRLPAPRSEFQVPAASQRTGRATEFVERVEAQPAPHRAAADPNARPDCFDSPSDRYEWLMQHRGAGWGADDAAWLATYASSADYRGLHDYFASRGLAWPEEDPSTFKTAG